MAREMVRQRKGSDGAGKTHYRCMSAAAQDTKEGGQEAVRDEKEEEEEEVCGGGGFLSVVRGNNLTLNDYIQMMNTGLYNDTEENDDNDTEIEEFKN